MIEGLLNKLKYTCNKAVAKEHYRTICELYLYFSQLELEEVRTGGSHKHSREKLGVGFHLEQRKEQKLINRKFTSKA